MNKLLSWALDNVTIWPACDEATVAEKPNGAHWVSDGVTAALVNLDLSERVDYETWVEHKRSKVDVSQVVSQILPEVTESDNHIDIHQMTIVVRAVLNNFKVESRDE